MIFSFTYAANVGKRVVERAVFGPRPPPLIHTKKLSMQFKLFLFKTTYMCINDAQ